MTKIQMISNVMDNFDFDNVEKTMEYLNWTWQGRKKSPSIEQLKQTAEDLLLDAVIKIEKELDMKPQVSYVCGIGGFEATAILGENHKVCYVDLKFVLSEWSANEEDYEIE